MNSIAKNNRLLSIDVLRGITIAGMILVNNAGACGYAYAPLRHSKWDGFSPADLVFPMFMFLMGISTYISLKKYDFQYHLTIKKIIKRSVLLFLIGFAMEWFLTAAESGDWINLEQVRILGVMQRLGICYGITALLAIFTPHKYFIHIAFGMLISYFLLQIFGNGFEKSSDNIIGIIDSTILGTNHIYLQGKQFVDPEGLLSSIPAITQVMFGFVCGKIIINHSDNQKRIVILSLIGAALLFGGYLFSYACPLNKRLWSPSFALVTSGTSFLILSLLIFIIDIKQSKSSWTTFFKIFGINPLLLYIMGHLFGEFFRQWNVNKILFENVLQPFLGNYFGSFMYAALFLMLNWLVGYILYKKQIYIKL